MKKQIIEKLNNGVDPKELGFTIACDDGDNKLFVKKWGRGNMQVNCTIVNYAEYDADIEPAEKVYDDEIEGWNQE